MGAGKNITETMTAEEQRLLETEFGPQPCFGHALFSKEELLSVHGLTPQEAWFFDPDTFVSERCVVQTLYKFQGTFTTFQFNRALRLLIDRVPFLRSGYIRLPDRVVRVVFLTERQSIDVFYRNLSGQSAAEIKYALNGYMDADIRRGFELSRGPLFRFAIFHTGQDEYAILLTILAIVKNRLDLRLLFDALDMRPIPDVPTEEPTFPDGGSLVAEPIRQYWSKILADLPPRPELPYDEARGKRFSQRAYHMALPSDVVSMLRERSEGNQNMLMCILQTAWGLFLQHANASADTYYCVLMPIEQGKAASLGLHQTMLPIRLRTEPSQRVCEIIAGQFRQMLTSRPYSCFDRKGLSDLLGNQRKLFGHFLSFGSFGRLERSYADARASSEGTPVAENIWDANGMPLGVYFHTGPSGIALNFLYDAAHFASENIAKIAKEYQVTLLHALVGWDNTMEQFRTKLSTPLAMSGHVTPWVLRHPAETILKGLTLFDGVRESGIHKLAPHTKRITHFESDFFPLYDERPMLYFLAEGQVARYMEGSSGWLNLLDFASKGAWLNETVFLEKSKSKPMAEVLSEEAQILAVPMAAFEALLSEEPFLMRRLFLHVLREMEKYQRSWVDT